MNDSAVGHRDRAAVSVVDTVVGERGTQDVETSGACRDGTTSALHPVALEATVDDVEFTVHGADAATLPGAVVIEPRVQDVDVGVGGADRAADASAVLATTSEGEAVDVHLLHTGDRQNRDRAAAGEQGRARAFDCRNVRAVAGGQLPAAFEGARVQPDLIGLHVEAGGQSLAVDGLAGHGIGLHRALVHPHEGEASGESENGLERTVHGVLQCIGISDYLSICREVMAYPTYWDS